MQVAVPLYVPTIVTVINVMTVHAQDMMLVYTDILVVRQLLSVRRHLNVVMDIEFDKAFNIFVRKGRK